MKISVSNNTANLTAQLITAICSIVAYNHNYYIVSFLFTQVSMLSFFIMLEIKTEGPDYNGGLIAAIAFCVYIGSAWPTSHWFGWSGFLPGFGALLISGTIAAIVGIGTIWLYSATKRSFS